MICGTSPEWHVAYFLWDRCPSPCLCHECNLVSLVPPRNLLQEFLKEQRVGQENFTTCYNGVGFMPGENTPKSTAAQPAPHLHDGSEQTVVKVNEKVPTDFKWKCAEPFRHSVAMSSLARDNSSLGPNSFVTLPDLIFNMLHSKHGDHRQVKCRVSH